MSLPNQLVGKNIQSRTVYNGSGTAIPFGTALALDASYPPQTYNAPGVKTTTGATDVVGFAFNAVCMTASKEVKLSAVNAMAPPAPSRR